MTLPLHTRACAQNGRDLLNKFTAGEERQLYSRETAVDDSASLQRRPNHVGATRNAADVNKNTFMSKQIRTMDTVEAAQLFEQIRAVQNELLRLQNKVMELVGVQMRPDFSMRHELNILQGRMRDNERRYVGHLLSFPPPLFPSPSLCILLSLQVRPCGSREGLGGMKEINMSLWLNHLCFDVMMCSK